MADRATVFEGCQIGGEEVAGTEVSAGVKLQSLSIEPGMQAGISFFRPMGQKFDTLSALGKEWVQANITGKATYTEIVYALASILGKPDIQTPGGGTLARSWTFTIDADGPDTPQTYTVEAGGSVRAHKFVYGILNEFGIDFSRDEIALSGSMLGRALQDAISMSPVVTVIGLVPILPTQVDVYLADTAAGLDIAAPLTRPLTLKWSLTDRFGMVYPLASTNNTGWAAHIEKAPNMTATMVMEADAEGMALLTTMRTGATKFLRIKATGVTDGIEAGQPYSFKLDMACQVANPQEFSDQDGVFAVGWELKAVTDATWGKAIEVVVVNNLTAIAGAAGAPGLSSSPSVSSSTSLSPSRSPSMSPSKSPSISPSPSA